MKKTQPKYSWCVIVPTYNNERTLVSVLEGVLRYTSNVLVINDGSTDSTAEILERYSHLTLLTHTRNQGKGAALKNGFRKAMELGFEFAITIDSDGQHFPDDIPVFLNRLDNSDGNILLIGARNMSQEGVPRKSSFGNKFSNFWFQFETGIKLQDTQSGFRLYPLQKMPKRYFTPKFEFEIESIVRAAWSGVEVENVPVKVHYDLQDRVSHFRPFRDFTRISILNTVLVIITLLYIKPRDFLRNLKKKDFKKFLKEEILESNDSRSKKSFSMALGVFWGIIPLWGFQTLGVISSAYILRLNKLIAFTFSNVSLPPFIPFIIFGSLKVGGLFVQNPVSVFSSESLSMDFVKKHLQQYVIGSSILAVVSAALVGILGFLLLNLLGKNKATANA
jgi:glycosyltransferase involved in cell wall biosynthesis